MRRAALPLLLLTLAAGVEAVRAADKSAARRAREDYQKSVEAYNAQVLRSKSLIDEESRRLQGDMEKMRRRSERMREELGEAMTGLPGAEPYESGGAPLEGDPPAAEADAEPWLPRLARNAAPFAALAVLAAVAYAVERRRPERWRRKPRVVLKCPGCKRRLRVKKSEKRVRVRCPECGTESAYNPDKKAA